MDSHFSIEFQDENRLIRYLQVSFNSSELRGICRELNLNVDEVFNKLWTKPENCEGLVEAVRQGGIYHELFRILQLPRYWRTRFSEVFPQFHVRVVDARQETALAAKVYEAETSLVGGSLAEWVARSKEKTVLILGKDNPDLFWQQLKRLAHFVQHAGYTPILLKEQPEINTLTNEEKMLAYSAISRFVVIEKSDPAGQIDEAKICAFNRIPAIWLQRAGAGDTWMQSDYDMDFKFIRIFTYDENDLADVIGSAVGWMEQFLESKADALNRRYPWRS